MMSSDDFQYRNVQGLVAGVEFDVRLDPKMKKCHIICIFDAKNKIENYNKIIEAINHNKLTDPTSFYEKEAFAKYGINLSVLK